MELDLLVNDFVYRAIHDCASVSSKGTSGGTSFTSATSPACSCTGFQYFESMRGLPYNVGLDDANLSKLELLRIKAQLPQFVYLERHRQGPRSARLLDLECADRGDRIPARLVA